MKRDITIILRLFVLLHLVTHIDTIICPVPPPCNCTEYSGTRAYCNDRNLSKIPPLIKSEGTWIIDFSNNHIESIEAHAFKNIQLEQVYFSNNSITRIDEDAFSGSETSMDVLRLDGNQLKSVPKLVTKLVGLIGLDIQYNKITHLDESILSNMSKSFIAVSFGSPEMSFWPASLRHLKGLLMLSVYGLPIKNFPENAFLGFEKSLNYLEIDSTQFHNIPINLNKLENLQYLTIKGNKFILELPERAFEGLNNLSTLTIENNGLASLPAIYKDSPSMYQTFIRNNPIVNLSASTYVAKQQPQFHYLTLTHTQFYSIPEALSNMEEVWVIDLSHGRIEIVKSSDFKNIPALANLIFSFNPMYAIDDNAFMNLPSLKYLSLDNTKLTTVPKAIKNSNLSWINLNGTAVVCSCDDLGWMKTWPHRLQITILGTCKDSGDLIMNFIKNNVPKC